jgi:hypothetical protein
MDTDTKHFLETLLFDADNPDEKKRPFKEARIDQFSKPFQAGVEKFCKGFREFLRLNGFDVYRLRDLERSFGGNVYWSMSGAGCGFFDDRDMEMGDELQALLHLYSGSDTRFYELSSNLDWHGTGRNRVIDLCFIPSALVERRDMLFEPPTPAQRLESLAIAGKQMAFAIEKAQKCADRYAYLSGLKWPDQ